VLLSIGCIPIIRAEEKQMSFKIGDKVIRVDGTDSECGFMVKGKEYVVNELGGCTIRVDGHKWIWDVTNFEPVSKKFDFKSTPWFIRVDNIEESFAAQEWLFAQGVSWCNGDTKVDDVGKHSVLTNYFVDNGISKNGFMHSLNNRYNDPSKEIKLRFVQSKLVVDEAVMPEVKSAQQIKIEELEETIRKANEEIQELKKEI
jgi:hypothetical protein